jgi:light-regulated signal transduction histidine kinase (bacteriophytochrome)
MDSLINGLLQISRTGRIKMVIKKIDMNHLFKAIIASNNYQISEISAKVIVDDLPDCYGDENQLNQLFSNIIGNAIKYRDKTKQLVINISGQLQYSKVTYSIKDNGIGIAQKYIEKIWDVFFRIDSNSSELGEGIGLSLAKRITDKHYGKIWVESEEGEGSTFFIELQKNEFAE